MSARKNITLFVLALLTLLSLTAAAPAPAFAAVPGCKQTHTVIAGEYLSTIAAIYKVNWFDLAVLNDLEDANLIYPGQVLCISVEETFVPVTPVLPTTARVSATSVVEDSTVTLKGKSLDSNSTYTVYLYNFKKLVPENILVGIAKTDATGAFSLTFSIPKPLFDAGLIGVYIVNARGDSTLNWFINTTGSKYLGGIGAAELAVAVNDVEEDDWVKITVSNLPPNAYFDVYIDETGSKHDDGVYVGHIRTTSGGSATATFDIPEALYGEAELEVLVKFDALQMSDSVEFENK